MLERVAKSVMQVFSFAFVGNLARYRPIHATTIARAMLGAAALQAPGTSTYENEQMTALTSGRKFS